MNRRILPKHLGITLLGVMALAGIAVVCMKQRHETSERVAPNPYAGIDMQDPQMSYLVLRHACETGGTERTRELAIDWLDTQCRHRTPLTDEQEDWLMGILKANGHASWDPEYRFWIFNSAFNVLHMGTQQETLSRLLVKLAIEAPEKTMRLYALQHITLQRGMGHLTGPLADEVRSTLQTLASQPGSPVAGSALATLITWDGPETPAAPELIALALELATNPACDVDIRVTVLHAARENALDLARQLAADAKQPVHLRKAAIAAIGQYGQAQDCAALEILCGENFRLAQAAEPALKAIQQRLSHPQAAEPIPF